MPLAAGTRLGPYEILARIGAGGMGEVYKARDTRLDRIVAVKISKEQFSERFEREAYAIAALNHPNICQLYDVGPNYLVMEYIEGQPLKGPLPLDIALKYATQICDALEAAHKKGISHRDLKPENILVTKAGIKLLDFGLAKRSLLPEEGGATQTIALTQENTILGTLQYMAPEQLEAKPADARSDIFAFGTVLYEMVTGKRAFVGKSSASLISAIMSSEPVPMSGLQPMTSPALDRVVMTCLAKDPEERWQSARDVKHALECIAFESVKAPAGAAGPRRHRELAGYALALCLASALVILYFRQTDRPASSARILFTVPPPEKAAFQGGSAAAISPDGSRLVAAFRSPDSRAGLWIRPLDSMAWQPVPDTAVGTRPAWSPDGQSLVFAGLTVLQKVDLSGGPRQTLCSGRIFYSPSWGSAGVILVALPAGPVYRVPASGAGPCAPATTLDAAQAEIGHYAPKFLPDGHHFLFLSRGAGGTGTIWAGSLDSKERLRLVSGTGGAAYAGPPRGPGHLLYEREGIALAQPFDPVRLRLLGEPVPIPGLRKVSAYQANGVPSTSASESGVLIQRDATEVTELVWFDRSGRRLSEIARGDAYTHLALSPDDTRVIYTAPDEVSSGADLLVVDLSRGNAKTRLNGGETLATVPVWSNDGAQVAWASSRGGSWGIYRKPANGTGQAELLVESRNWMIPSCWSADGRYLVYHETDQKTGFHIWLLPLSGDRKPQSYLRTQSEERNGQISPDGRWMAYASYDSGHLEVYVRTFPDANGGKWLVSVGGGSQPVWRRDGRELFFLSPEMKVLSVEVKNGRGGFEASQPRVLFGRPRAGLSYTNLAADYAVSADGQRFLANTALDEPGASSITVLTNWTAGLKK